MKKTISLLLVVLFAAAFFTGCAAQKTKVTVLVVKDEGDDGSYEETFFEEEIEVEGKDPSIDTIVNQLVKEDKISAEYSQDDNGNSVIASINDLENKNEGTDPIKFYQWIAKINEEDDISGLWSDAIVKEGDTVTIRYAIWEAETDKK